MPVRGLEQLVHVKPVCTPVITDRKEGAVTRVYRAEIPERTPRAGSSTSRKNMD
jgi:hypothetical protein